MQRYRLLQNLTIKKHVKTYFWVKPRIINMKLNHLKSLMIRYPHWIIISLLIKIHPFHLFTFWPLWTKSECLLIKATVEILGRAQSLRVNNPDSTLRQAVAIHEATQVILERSYLTGHRLKSSWKNCKKCCSVPLIEPQKPSPSYICKGKKMQWPFLVILQISYKKKNLYSS